MLLVDLLVRVDLDGGAGRGGGQPAPQVCVEQQVAVLVRPAEALADAEPLEAWTAERLRLAVQLATCSVNTVTRQPLLGATRQVQPLTGDAEAVGEAGLLQGEGPADDSAQRRQQPEGGAQPGAHAADGHVRAPLLGDHVGVEVLVPELLPRGPLPHKQAAAHLPADPLRLPWKREDGSCVR